MRSGLRLALTTFTVLPLRAGRVDRPAAALAMSLAPLVGALLGAALGGSALGLRALHTPALMTGAAVVAAAAAATRGLHLDGLADTVDGLGSYADRERALAIMRRPEVGPFGVVALILAVLVPAAGIAGTVGRPAPYVLAGIVTATATGRLAVSYACRRGVPAARPEGLGALVAGSVGYPALAAGTALVLGTSLAAVPGRIWQGPLAVLLALASGLALTRHARRRLGGVTGDVLGANVELAGAVVYLVLCLGGS